MAGNIEAIAARNAQIGVQLNSCPRLYKFIEVIAQIAIKILFITGSILIAAAAFPISWHPITIPIVATGTTLLAGFFYPQPNLIRGPLFAPLPPLIKPLQLLANGELAPDFPADCPRGFVNIAQNCALNSMAQMVNSDTPVAEWMRHPITDAIDMAAFRNVIQGYNPPANVLDQFEAYFNLLPEPRPPIRTAFSAFLQIHVPPIADLGALNALRRTYENLLLLQPAFSQFFRANDAAVQARQSTSQGNSQTLRAALSQASAMVNPSPNVQMDLAEVVEPLLDVLPNRLKTNIETLYHYNTNGLPPLLEPPQPKREHVGFFSLPITGENPSLPALFETYRNNANAEPQKRWGVDRSLHNYPVARVEVNILEPPPALRFQLKRFDVERPPVSWYSHLPILSYFYPPLGVRQIKIETPVECPEEFSLTLKDGRVVRYRLNCFVNHLGRGPNSGHYTSAKIAGGNKYMMNDSRVTLVNPEQQEVWNEALRHSYFVQYELVPEPAGA
jgi:hypothetical protein